MPADIVDSIVAELIIRDVEKYEAGYARVIAAHRKAAKSMDDLAAASTKMDAALAKGGSRQRATQDAEQSEQRVARSRRKRTDDAVAQDDRELRSAKKAAKEKADAEIAEAQRSARIREAVERGVAKSGVTPGSGRSLGTTVPRMGDGGQRLMASTSVRAIASADPAVEKEINHALLDQFDLRQRIRVADRESARSMQDELTAIRRAEEYRRAGLSHTEAAARAEREMAAIEQLRARKAADLSEHDLRRNQGQTASTLRSAAGVIGGYVTARELTEITDAYTKFTNRIKIAGVAQSEQRVVEDSLFASAQKYGVELNSLGDLYGKASQAAASFGGSQSDVLRFTDGVAAALKVQGGSTESARGALLQLSQLLQTGTVRAEEFNSVNEGAFPILQAVATGAERFGGSVAKLRQEVLSGTVTSQEFFRAFLAGSATLEERAAKSTLTTAAGFTTLKNALEVYIGRANEASGVSAAVGAGLHAIADNLDTLIPALAVVSTALGVGFVTNAVAATVAARGIGAAVLGAFGGPVGLAITAITVTLGAFAVAAADTEARVRAANAAYDEMQQRLQTAAGQAASAAGGVKGVGTDALGAIPKVNAFAGAVGSLAQALYDQARAARVARIELLQKRLTESQSAELGLAKDLPAERDSTAQFRRGDFLNNAGVLGRAFVGDTRSLLSGGRTDRDIRDAYSKQVQVSLGIMKELKEAQSAPITAGDLPGGAPTNPNATKIAKAQAEIADFEKLKAGASGKELTRINQAIALRERRIRFLQQGVSSEVANYAAGTGRRSGPSAETLEKRAEAERKRKIRDQEEYDRDLRQAQSGYLSEQADLTNDAAKRADVERERVRFQRDQLDKEIAAKGPGKDGTGEYTAEQVTTLQGINDQTADLRIASIDLAERRRIADDARSIDRAALDQQREQLQAQLGLADTVDERRKIALQILDLEYRQREAELRAVLAADSKATAAEKEIAQKQLDALPSQKELDRRSALRQNEGAGAAYLRDLKLDRPQFIESEEVKLLQAFNEGLDDSVKKALHLHGIFGDIIGDLIDMAIKQALIKPIAAKLFGGEDAGSGGGIGGFFSSIVSAAGAVFGGGSQGNPSGVLSLSHESGHRASGGNVVGGQLYRVNELGTEYFQPAASGRIYPMGAMPNVRGSSGPGLTVIAPQHYDLSGVVMTEDLVKGLREDNRRYANAVAAQAGHAAVAAGPARIQRMQTLGS